MYQTKVEQVDGWRVRADGKWLRCIGNKKVRVGDLIWTDGRCVYGYDRDSTTPLVIVPQKTESDIPILFSSLTTDYEVSFRVYEIFAGVYKRISSATSLKNTKIYPFYGRMTNNKNKIFCREGHFNNAYSLYTSAFATNVDEQGHYYELYWSIEYGKTEIKIIILKDTTIIQSLKINTIGYFSANRVSCFIENENNWWLVYTADDKDNHTESINGIITEFNVHAIVGFINASGHRILVDRLNDQYTEFYTDIQFPMQDGFYFKITNVKYNLTHSLLTGGVEFTGEKDIQIFSPTNKIITTLHQDADIKGNFLPIYLTACKLKANQFLICAYNQQGSYTPSKYNALYFCDNGKITTILDNVFFYNSCLRPMKNYKNWWKRMEELEIIAPFENFS